MHWLELEFYSAKDSNEAIKQCTAIETKNFYTKS